MSNSTSPLPQRTARPATRTHVTRGACFLSGPVHVLQSNLPLALSSSISCHWLFPFCSPDQRPRICRLMRFTSAFVDLGSRPWRELDSWATAVEPLLLALLL